MNSSGSLTSSRIEEIVGLAETVAGTTVPVDPETLLRARPDVSVAFGSFGDAYDGLIEHRDGKFWVYCNEARTGPKDSPRSRFTLAHEAGHYFIDEHRIALEEGRVGRHPSRTDYESDELAEREADLFATHLLMPTVPFVAAMRRAAVGAPAVLELKARFGASVTSTAIRYVGLADFFCVVVKWTAEGYGWRWTSREARAGRYFRTVQSLGDLPADSATRLLAAGVSSRNDFIERGSVASAWFDYVKAGGHRDEILLEHAVSLGRFGLLTILFPASLQGR